MQHRGDGRLGEKQGALTRVKQSESSIRLACYSATGSVEAMARTVAVGAVAVGDVGDGGARIRSFRQGCVFIHHVDVRPVD